MKKAKMYFSLLAVVLILVLGIGMNTAEAQAPKKIVLKIAHVVDPSHHYELAAKEFKKKVEEKTKGQVVVETYPNSQLGNERAILEGLQMGSIQMGIITSGALSGFVPEFAILDMGYLFKDEAEAMKILNGPIGQEFSQKMLKVGIRDIGTLKYSYRSVYANKAINTPADLKGMKIRTMENPAHMAIFKALGASPTPMAYGELYTAIQQKVVDGAENLPDLYFNSKHFEVAKVYSLTNHVFCIVKWMISEETYKKLPADVRTIVMDCAKEALKWENEVSIPQQMSGALGKLEKGGVKIVRPDIQPFRAIVKNSWSETAKKFPNGEANLKMLAEAIGVKL